MKIQCISNVGKHLPDDCLKPSWGFDKKKEFPIIVGKTYTVYAFTVQFGYVWFYICDESFSYYPVWNPAPLFEIVDHRVSKLWELNCHVNKATNERRIIVAFPEWARDSLYYDRLTNGVEQDVKIFAHYKTIIDAENID